MFHLRNTLIFNLLLFLDACSNTEKIAPESEPEPCVQLSTEAIQDASNPLVGNWRWIKSKSAGLNERTPASEGYEECWVFMPNDTLVVCRADTLAFRIKIFAEFKLNPYTKQDSVYTILNTAIVTFTGDTMQIFDSWVDGTDYWLVRDCP